jgi:hypothetical protein
MSDETTSAADLVVSVVGGTIRLTLYSEASVVATVALDLVRAVALAGPLIIEASLWRLSSPSCNRLSSGWPEKSLSAPRGDALQRRVPSDVRV